MRDLGRGLHRAEPHGVPDLPPHFAKRRLRSPQRAPAHRPAPFSAMTVPGIGKHSSRRLSPVARGLGRMIPAMRTAVSRLIVASVVLIAPHSVFAQAGAVSPAACERLASLALPNATL